MRLKTVVSDKLVNISCNNFERWRNSLKLKLIMPSLTSRMTKCRAYAVGGFTSWKLDETTLSKTWGTSTPLSPFLIRASTAYVVSDYMFHVQFVKWNLFWRNGVDVDVTKKRRVESCKVIKTFRDVLMLKNNFVFEHGSIWGLMVQMCWENCDFKQLRKLILLYWCCCLMCRLFENSWEFHECRGWIYESMCLKNVLCTLNVLQTLKNTFMCTAYHYPQLRWRVVRSGRSNGGKSSYRPLLRLLFWLGLFTIIWWIFRRWKLSTFYRVVWG